MVLFLLACGAPETPDEPTPAPPTEPWPVTIVDLEPIELVVETLDAEGDSAVSLGDHELLLEVDGEATLRDPWGALDGLGTALGTLYSAVVFEGDTLVSTASGMVVVDTAVQPTSVGDALPSPPSEMAAHGDVLWMGSEMALHQLRDGQLQQVSLDGATPVGFGPGQVDQSDVLWVGSGPQLVALRADAQGVTVAHALELFGEVSDVASSRDGSVWAAVDGWLVQRRSTGSAERLDLGSPVRELVGDGGPAVWARTDEGWRVGVDGEWFQVELPGVPVGGIDREGRLLVRTDTGVARVGLGRPLSLLGLPDGGLLIQPVTVRAVPSDLEALTEISAALTGDGTFAIEVDAEDGYAMSLDPGGYPDGAYTLDVTATHGAESTTVSTPIVVGDLEVTWSEHIEPINRRICQDCHDSDALFIHLVTATDWEVHYDLILSQVTPQPPIMPTLGEPLSGLELFLLEQWGADGFQ